VRGKNLRASSHHTQPLPVRGEGKRGAAAMLTIKETAAGVQFAVRVVPGASRNEVAGVQDDALKVRLAAPAV